MIRSVGFFFVFALLAPRFGLTQAASSEGKECVETYSQGQLGTSRGVLVQISPEEKDQEFCKGKVGESFCLNDRRKEYLQNCQERKVVAEQKEAEKAIKLHGIVRDAEKKAEEQRKKDEEGSDFIDTGD